MLSTFHVLNICELFLLFLLYTSNSLSIFTSRVSQRHGIGILPGLAIPANSSIGSRCTWGSHGSGGGKVCSHCQTKSVIIPWFPQQNESFIPRFEVFGSSMIFYSSTEIMCEARAPFETSPAAPDLGSIKQEVQNTVGAMSSEQLASTRSSLFDAFCQFCMFQSSVIQPHWLKIRIIESKRVGLNIAWMLIPTCGLWVICQFFCGANIFAGMLLSSLFRQPLRNRWAVSLGVEEDIFFCNLKLLVWRYLQNFMFEVQKQEVHKDRPNANRQEARRCIQRMRCDRSLYLPIVQVSLSHKIRELEAWFVHSPWLVLAGQSIWFPPKAQVAWDQKQMEQDVQDWKLWKLCLSLCNPGCRQSQGGFVWGCACELKNWRLASLVS